MKIVQEAEKAQPAPVVLDEINRHLNDCGYAAIEWGTNTVEVEIANHIADLIDKTAQVVPECEWTPDDGNPDEATSWESDCGKSWFFYEGGPEENNQHFCGNCGGRVLLSAAQENAE